MALGLIVVPVLAGLAAAGNAGILAASRYPLAMARDNLISPKIRRSSAASRLRRWHCWPPGGLMVLAIWTLDVLSVAKLASTFQLLIFALVNLAVIVMRESRIEAYDPGFRSPGYPWVQVVGLLDTGPPDRGDGIHAHPVCDRARGPVSRLVLQVRP